MKKNIDLIIDGIAPEKVMYDTDNHSLVVLYPAQNEFKKGDILASDDILLIFDKYEMFNQENDLFYSLWNSMGISNKNWMTKSFTYATDEQKSQLHEELAREGKKWNAEKLEIEDLDISEIVIDLETACEYLEIKRPLNFILDVPCERSNKFETQMELQLICEAWNKFDGFEIDWDDDEQNKHYPMLRSDESIGHRYTSAMPVHISTSCYSFPTKERALQFGNQFKELFKTAMGM